MEVTWSEPEQGNYANITKYRVEVKKEWEDGKEVEGGEWKTVCTTSAQWDQTIKLSQVKTMELDIDCLRAIAVNCEGESEPSDVTQCSYDF